MTNQGKLLTKHKVSWFEKQTTKKVVKVKKFDQKQHQYSSSKSQTNFANENNWKQYLCNIAYLKKSRSVDPKVLFYSVTFQVLDRDQQ